jgi:hypothetical protein
MTEQRLTPPTDEDIHILAGLELFKTLASPHLLLFPCDGLGDCIVYAGETPNGLPGFLRIWAGISFAIGKNGEYGILYIGVMIVTVYLLPCRHCGGRMRV